MHARRSPATNKSEFDSETRILDPQICESIPLRVRAAIAELLQDHRYAVDLCEDAWEFATEVNRLRSFGVSDNDMRWMLGRQWLQHARRTYDNGRRLQYAEFIDDDSCFVLTEMGVRVAEELQRRTIPRETDLISPVLGMGPKSGPTRGADIRPPAKMPRWDAERHRLYVGEILVKEFRVPSPNQTRILQAFDEEQWPLRIDDPLPNSADIDPKERLRYTIKSLNKHQKIRAIRFGGDGSGEGIIWESVLEERLDHTTPHAPMQPSAPKQPNAPMQPVAPRWRKSDAV